MCIIICDDKSYHPNFDIVPIDKDLFLKHGSEGFKPPHLQLKLMDLNGIGV
jgi:hypothetical protein